MEEAILNNREIAILIWVAIGLVIILTKKSLRQSFISVINAAFAYKLVICYLSAVLYSAIGIPILYRLKLWQFTELKETISWLVTVASVTLFKINQVDEKKNYFSEAVKDNFKFTVIIEFITSAYSFNIVYEFLLVPIILFLVVMQVFASNDKKYQPIKAITTWLLAIIGGSTIFYSFYEIINHFHNFVKIEKFHQFIVSPFLSIWFLPFLFMFARYMKYGTTFVAMGFALKSPSLLRYAKRQAVWYFLFDKEGLERWKGSLFRLEIKTNNDIRSSIKEIKNLQKIEKNPPVINRDTGWSPYEAKDFLKDQGFTTGYYTELYGEWAALSSYIPLEKTVLSDTICYSVIGNRSTVHTLELVLSKHLSPDIPTATSQLLNYAKILFKKALKDEMPFDIEYAILQSSIESASKNNITVSVRKDKWADENKGYTLLFSIKHG